MLFYFSLEKSSWYYYDHIVIDYHGKDLSLYSKYFKRETFINNIRIT